jgi:metal-responsive CopG/Arc/MetJ family transcriptional regulator
MVEKKSEWDFEQTQRFEMIIPIRLLKAVDAWRKRQPSAPNRSAAIRRLIEAGIEAEERRRK